MSFLFPHQWSLAVFSLLILVISVLNVLFGMPALKVRRLRNAPHVSILIPVRNERRNIERCLTAALAQEYPNFEVLVYEDNSEDGTAQILSQFYDPKLQVVFGSSPPSGWYGKHWACWNLAQMAKGEYLLFIDADVVLSPLALSSAVARLEEKRLEMLSLLPHQEIGSLGELLLVPLIPWSLFSFFPAFLERLVPVALGQFILIEKEAYERLGGHQRIKSEIVDDLALARLAKKERIRMGFFLAGELVRCRMYAGLREALRGLSKNLYPVFGKRPLAFLFIWLWLWYVTWQPFLVLALTARGLLPWEFFLPGILAILAQAANWGLVAFRSKLPKILLIIFPAIVFLSAHTALRSFLWHNFGRGEWKGRTIHLGGKKR